MSTNEIAVTGRCETHPGRPAVGRCESCGRLLCIGCAVPVRGQVLGPECVGEVLGPEAVQGVAAPPRRPRRPALALAGVGFGGAVAASVLPWSNRFSSHETGLFGGWGLSPLAWSAVAAAAAVIGAVAWSGAWWRSGRQGWLGWGMLAMALLVTLGAILYMLAPPPFSHPWLGPWVALGAGAAAAGGLLWDRRRGAAAPARSS